MAVRETQGGFAANSPPVGSVGDRVNAWYSPSGVQSVFITSLGGTSVDVGGSGDAEAQPTGLAVRGYNSLYNGATWVRARGDTFGAYVVCRPATSGGLTHHRISPAVALANVKAAAANLYSAVLLNTNAAIRYFQIYNKSTAPVLGTDTPVLTIALPPNVPVILPNTPMGSTFNLGFGWAVTTDDIAIPAAGGAAGDVHGTLFYS